MALVVCGAGAWLASWVAASRDEPDKAEVSGRALERQAWRRLWMPMLPAAIAFATLVGWACQEPSETDEALRPAVAVIALPLALLWLRCAVRACLALRRPRVMPEIATLGLFRPQVVIADRLHGVLDPEAFAAALAHEQAHVRHLDPLRIWLAQIATDLQWPNPSARRRLDRWLASLEFARDEEARVGGTHGVDLAAAVVAVARTMRTRTPPTLAPALVGLTGPEALAARVHRLIDPLRADDRAGSMVVPLAVVSALVAAVVFGLEHGDAFLRALPFIVV
jgi:hypothetical protein